MLEVTPKALDGSYASFYHLKGVPMQIIHVIGYLGDDPEMKYTTDGQPVTNFSVAVNDPRDKGEDAKPTWYRVATWGKSAEAANEHLRKGDRVGVVGSLRIRGYADKDDLQAWSNDINANHVEYLTPKEKPPAGERQESETGAPRRPAASTNAPESDAGEPDPQEPDPPAEPAAPAAPASRPRTPRAAPKAR